jgi:hypothetical protein
MLIDKMDGHPVDSVSLMRQVGKVMEELKMLRDDYQGLWLKTNKPDNLQLVTDKFNRMLSYFSEIHGQLATGRLRPPLIESKWIYKKQNDTAFAPVATFRYEFDLKSKPNSALLQLIGDSYCKLYVNGQFVDSVFACLQLSLKVEYERVKMKDVAAYLKTGKNTIEVQARSFK